MWWRQKPRGCRLAKGLGSARPVEYRGADRGVREMNILEVEEVSRIRPSPREGGKLRSDEVDGRRRSSRRKFPVGLGADLFAATAGEEVHGVPARGYVLSSAVEEIARDGRHVVGHLRDAFMKHPDMLPGFPPGGGVAGAERAAWRVFSVWLLKRVADPSERDLSLASAQAWFDGGSPPPSEIAFWSRADRLSLPRLKAMSKKRGIRELLPYILESHGPGSRLSVMRDPTTQVARSRKKEAGVFYTPPDVAEFMVAGALRDGGPVPTALDPAVGTGVFLRAVLNAMRASGRGGNSYDLALARLFGCDIDPMALDGAATVILADVIGDAMKRVSTPGEAWLAIRANLRTCDALLIDPSPSKSRPKGRITLAELYPEASDGFDLIIGNPPYADIGPRSDIPALASTFKTIEACPRGTADLYPAFVEQMTRLAKPDAAGALVLPLSIACNSSPQFRACRRFIAGQKGTWRFAFFDRQPHALFGEDVKTRNAVVFRRGGSARALETGPMRKWRGAERRDMFRRIDYTPIACDISTGIPKLHGAPQAAAWEKMSAETRRLADVAYEFGSTTLDAMRSASSTAVFVSPTAYNFLGVARSRGFRAGRDEVLSTNPLLRVDCATEQDADAVYAILSGNYAFWWWHVTGDGFHVGRSALKNLPVGGLFAEAASRDRLADLGRKIWNQSMLNPVRSLNRGRVSYAFSAQNAPELRSDVDELVLKALGLPDALVDELSEFNQNITAARLLAPAVTGKGEKSA